MPIHRPDPKPLPVECDSCGQMATTVFNDVAEDEPDTELPAGWVLMPLRRVVENDVLADEVADHRAHLESVIMNQIEAAAGGAVPEDEVEQAEAFLQAQVEGAMSSYEPMEAPLKVEILECVLCVECSGFLQARLDLPDWDEGSDEDGNDGETVTSDSTEVAA